MASEEAGGGELMVEQPLRPHYDGGVVSGSARASAPSEVDATSTATNAIERYPINAILFDKDGDVKPATQAIEEGVTSSAEHAQSGGAPSEHSIREEHVQVHDEKEKDELEDVEMQDHVRARQIDTSTPADGLISHGSPGNQHRTAASASMSSASSSTLTSSSSSAINLSEPLSMSTLTKHTHSGAERTTSSIPSASEFVQKSDAANQVPKRQRIPRACDSCRRKKIRCNLSSAANSSDPTKDQACANCHQSGVQCTFTKSPAKRGPNKGYIQQLENRLAALESSVSSETSAEVASGSSQSRTARTQGLLPSTGTKNASPQTALPPQKKARLSDTLPSQSIPPHLHAQPIHHPLQILPPSHPFSARTPSNETWSRTTAPPTLYSSNSFFLSSTNSQPNPTIGRHPHHEKHPHHSPPLRHSEGSPSYASKSTLPPISSLISTLPPPEKHVWSHNNGKEAECRALSSSSYQPNHPRDARESEPSYRRPQEDHDEMHPPSRRIPSRQPSYNQAFYADYAPQHQASNTYSQVSRSPRLHPHDYPLDQRGMQYDGPRPGRSPSMGSSASFHQSLPDYSPNAETRLRWPSSASASTSTSPKGAPSALSRLDRSAVLSLDSSAFRRAVFDTPAMRTFSILPPFLLKDGFQNCPHLIKAAHLLSTSSATLTYTSDVVDDSQWQTDSSAVIGECMIPMRFDNTGSDMTCREIESLMMCYVDALRRGKLIAGILGAISGKLAILETRGIPCKRYQAVGILLAVWHTVGYSSRRMYFGTPSTSGPDALYTALETRDPTILAMCIFTYNLDKMCRRYCQNGETYVPPESIEFTRVIAASSPEPLPKAQLRMLSILDSFLLALNFAYNQSLTALPSMESLERQRHHLHSIVNDADSSDILNLLVGPHVLAMVACATLYCLAACREKGETEVDPEQKQNIRTLERDYLSILDALRNVTVALSATPDSSRINSHPFADGGDMRLLYSQIARFVKVNLAAAISSSKEQLTASQVITNLHSMGYLGTVLAASQEQDGFAS